jgi:superfamily II DNA or RNA helicase
MSHPLRPYQKEFCTETWKKMCEFDRVLGIAPTGSGKTRMACALSKRAWEKHKAKTIFLVNREELITQAEAAYQRFNGWTVDIEQAKQFSSFKHPVTVASIQTLANRITRIDPKEFKFIICDEAHMSLGAQYQQVLNYLEGKQLGVTATPNIRAGNLASYWETIGAEIDMRKLIQEGYLSKIMIQTFPCNLDTEGLRITRGDYDNAQVAERVEKCIGDVIDALRKYASNRKTLIFLPLIETSEIFAEALASAGFDAKHVSGQSKDRREILEWYATPGPKILCNSMLLTYGFDQPDIDCILLLRPTRSNVLYCQGIGRGTRIAEGKKDLLVLDPLWLVNDHKLCTPAVLVADDNPDQELIRKILQDRSTGDLLDIETDAKEQRLLALADKLKEKAKRPAKLIDPFEFAQFVKEPVLVEFMPQFEWEKAPPTQQQKKMLEKFGIWDQDVNSCGHASKIINACFKRSEKKLASFRQMRLLRQFKIPFPADITREDAEKIITAKIGKKK